MDMDTDTEYGYRSGYWCRIQIRIQTRLQRLKGIDKDYMKDMTEISQIFRTCIFPEGRSKELPKMGCVGGGRV